MHCVISVDCAIGMRRCPIHYLY